MSQPEMKGPRTPMPRWKLFFIILSAVLVVAGLGLKAHGMMKRKSAPPTSVRAPAPPGGMGLVAGGGSTASDTASGTGTTAEQPGTGEKLSPFLAVGGISFFGGLAVGTVLRMFFKIALGIVGIAVIGLVGLSYAGVIGPINWKSIEDTVNAGVVKAEEKTQGLQNQFLIGIPSAGMAGAGLVAGFKRK
jgi:uncharacterized membrane protein (Fun14 family)